jgi:hypothetical protein
MLRTRCYAGGSWSALRSIDFLADENDYSNLKITELQYHPPDEVVNADTILGQDLEFIEFKNTGKTSLNLTGLILDSAVYYAFPDNKLLGPKQFYVVASKPSRFYDHYGLIASGNYKGNLSNAGEELLLINGHDEDLLRFTYSDLNPWPVLADGTGYSLVSVEHDPTGYPGVPSYWRISSETGGSPFSDDPYPEQIINQSLAEYEITLYPNPASEYIFVHISALEEKQLMDVQIYNISGLLVWQSRMENNAAVNLRRLDMTTGMYLIRLQTDKYSGIARFVFLPHE